eukprot:3699217-Rhodomonas_salina.4
MSAPLPSLAHWQASTKADLLGRRLRVRGSHCLLENGRNLRDSKTQRLFGEKARGERNVEARKRERKRERERERGKDLAENRASGTASLALQRVQRHLHAAKLHQLRLLLLLQLRQVCVSHASHVDRGNLASAAKI